MLYDKKKETMIHELRNNFIGNQVKNQYDNNINSCLLNQHLSDICDGIHLLKHTKILPIHCNQNQIQNQSKYIVILLIYSISINLSLTMMTTIF